ALGGPLREQPARVPVAVVEVAEVGLLVRRGQRDRDGTGRQAAAYRDTGDDRGVPGLLEVEGDRGAGGGRRTTLGRWQQRADTLAGQPRHANRDRQSEDQQTA